ncbi:MAG: Putative sugar phosphate isomerase YwlF [Flavobacteriaceae bacterium]|jgi:ribose 5-phosphate isomerase B|nr:ribose 5-phosphate isomerase B [Flavobacteriaceae bacterium]CAI8236082.1 MAG: Putative sugar phosphate isomerase YwlF [Flavobacteriaceae bacterium]
MKLAIGNDHAGSDLKKKIVNLLQAQNIEVVNYGTDQNESVDYPDFAHPVGKSIQENKVDLAIVICGSGNGVNMVVNKYPKVRSALCWNTELAALARSHNNANILAIPARFVSEEVAIEMVNTFLTTPFEGGRHQNRVEKI